MRILFYFPSNLKISLNGKAFCEMNDCDYVSRSERFITVKKKKGGRGGGGDNNDKTINLKQVSC